ncbi:MAG: hypothetical protein IJU44_06345 [Kiritimatiellae bacterium]|nr:hypothetical protein [Kiritimatiellia bacterium]
MNRLLQLGARVYYFNEENRLCCNFKGETVPQTVGALQVEDPNKWYTMVIRYGSEQRAHKVFIGIKDTELKLSVTWRVNNIYSSIKDLANEKFGYCPWPAEGYLTSGQIGNVRFWNRELTDMECELVDLNHSVTMSEDDMPFGAPDGVKWDYFPLDGNAYRTKSTSMAALAQNTTLTNWVDAADRYRAEKSAITSTGNGLMTISNFHNMFGTSELDATYSFWINVAQLPSSDAPIMKRTCYNSSSLTGYGNFLMSLTSTGNRKFTGAGTTTTTFNSSTLPTNEWHLVTVVGKSGKSIQMFVDGAEIGNVASGLTMGYWVYNSSYYPTFTLGGWNGAADGLTFFHSALTSAQVRELYERQREQKVIHTVTQGVQSPQLNKSKVTAPAEGSTESVALTLAQSVQWTAQSNNSWIQITSDTAGAGSANISFTVGANPAVTSRTGSITVAGKNVTVVQNGLRASVECDDTSFGVESDSGTIWVETEGGGTWTASANVDWIHLLDTAGTGTSPVMFVVDDYTTTTASRSGIITVAGKKVVITQQGYELSIDPQVAEVGSNAGAGQFGVSAPIDAVWEAIADCDWITIISARTGIGDGVIQYTIADNLTGETRTGRIVIAGKAYTITQKTTLPITVKTIGSGTIIGAGNYNQGASVTLTAKPATGYVFSHWSGDAVGVSTNVTFIADTSKNVTATFIPESAAEQLAALKMAQGGFYTRDQIHALELGNLVLDVDAASGTTRVGVKLMETSDLTNPNSWRPAGITPENLDISEDGSVGLNVKATGNTKFFKVIVPGK